MSAPQIYSKRVSFSSSDVTACVGDAGMTYLYSRYVEHPWVAMDLRVPHRGLLRAAEALDVHAYLRLDLPPRVGDRPTVMQGLPQRQVRQPLL